MNNTGEWWPGNCRVNNIITTKERKQQILYQPKHPCRAGRLSKIFDSWVSLREWAGETVMARKVWTSETQGPKWRMEKCSSEVSLLSQKSVPLQWWSGLKHVLLSFPWLIGWRLPDPSNSKSIENSCFFPVICILLALSEEKRCAHVLLGLSLLSVLWKYYRNWIWPCFPLKLWKIYWISQLKEAVQISYQLLNTWQPGQCQYQSS